MFLIDSSVWIEYFRPGGSKKVKEKVKDILEFGAVVSCGIVTIEILRGVKNKKDFDELYNSLFFLPQIPIDHEVTERASRWGFEMDRKGRIASTTDLIIASAAYKKAKLLHLDNDFRMISEFYDIDEEMLS